MNDQRYPVFKVVLATLIILLLMGATYQRNKVWHSLLSLWQDSASKSPGKARVHNNLGNCHMLLGRRQEAVDEYRKALALDRLNIETYYNIAINLDALGRLGESAFYYDFFCKNAPPLYLEAQKESCVRFQEIMRSIQQR